MQGLPCKECFIGLISVRLIVVFWTPRISKFIRPKRNFKIKNWRLKMGVSRSSSSPQDKKNSRQEEPKNIIRLIT